MSLLSSAAENKRIIWSLLLLFFCLRLGIILFAPIDRELINTNDSYGYHSYALAIIENSDWLSNPDFFGHFREPGYPLFLAGIYKIFGAGQFTAVYIIQALISLFLCFLIYRMAFRIFGPRTALFSLVWAGIYIFYLHYVRWLLRETLIFFLLFVFLYTLFSFLKNDGFSRKYFYISLFTYFLLIMTDARYLFYLPFLLIPFVMYRSLSRGFLDYMKFCFLVGILLVPWNVRNYYAYDGLVIMNTETLDLRKSDNSEGSGLMRNLKFGRITECEVNKDYPTEEERTLIKSGLNPNNRTPAEVKAIRRDVYPATRFLSRTWFQFKEFWRPIRLGGTYAPCNDCRFWSWSFLHNLIFILWYGLLIPFFAAGVFKIIKTRKKDELFLLFPIAVHNLLHILQWALYRYRIPIDAFFIIISGFGIFLVYETIIKRR